jgi:hypothetical protein
MRHTRAACRDLVFLSYLRKKSQVFPASTAGRVRIMRLLVFLQRLYGHCDSCIGFSLLWDLQQNHIVLFIVSTSNCLCHGFNDFTANTVHQNFIVNQRFSIVLILSYNTFNYIAMLLYLVKWSISRWKRFSNSSIFFLQMPLKWFLWQQF